LSPGDNSRFTKILTIVFRIAIRRTRTRWFHSASPNGLPTAFTCGRVPASKGLILSAIPGPTRITAPPSPLTTGVHSPFLSAATDNLRPASTERVAKALAHEDLPVPTCPNITADMPEIMPWAYNAHGSSENAPPPLRSSPLSLPAASNAGPDTYG